MAEVIFASCICPIILETDNYVIDKLQQSHFLTTKICMYKVIPLYISNIKLLQLC